MRTSNKLLSGLILTGLLLIAGLFIFVRVQVARGAYVTHNIATDKESYWADIHKFDGAVKSVSIRGLKNIIVVPADSARLEIDKNAGKEIIWKLDNGVLTVMADTSREQSMLLSNAHVELFLPATDSITAINSDIDVKNTGDSTRKASYAFFLTGSTVNIKSDGRDPAQKPITYYHALRFDARNESTVKLEAGIVIDQFSVKLRGSALEAENEKVRFTAKPLIQTDNTSRLQLSGQHLSQAIITSTE